MQATQATQATQTAQAARIPQTSRDIYRAAVAHFMKTILEVSMVDYGHDAIAAASLLALLTRIEIRARIIAGLDFAAVVALGSPSASIQPLRQEFAAAIKNASLSRDMISTAASAFNAVLVAYCGYQTSLAILVPTEEAIGPS